MKKGKWILGSAIAFTFAGSVLAADLQNVDGQSCGALVGAWHFVNPQTGGEQTPGQLTVTFSSGVNIVTANRINRNNQHFDVIASGTLLSGYTNLDGRLVLSDFSCGEPPKCDPKKEECEPPPPPPCDPKTQKCD